MPQPNYAKNFLVVVTDFVGAIILFLYALIIGPLGVLRGPIVFERLFQYLWVLLPQGLLARSVRTMIDWRLGNFDSAISQMESLVGSSEEYLRLKPNALTRKRVLEDLYTVMTRAYLHAGHIDDAMLVVIRAKKSLNIDRLSGLAELDSKTAHLVRAGLAAGRLLDGGGLATLFVKSNNSQFKKPPVSPPQPLLSPGSQSSGDAKSTTVKRAGATAAQGVDGEENNVIQFPTSANRDRTPTP